MPREMGPRELGVDGAMAKTAAGVLLPAIGAEMGRSTAGGTTTRDPIGGFGSFPPTIFGDGSAADAGGSPLGGILGSIVSGMMR
jgi:hypothetical protein